MGDDNVRVALRVRPLVDSEIQRGCQVVVERTPGAEQVVVNRTEAFTFNHVFDASDSQEKVYATAVSELLEKLLKGFNATILAYGQTGSGKTFTMGTAFDGELNEDVGVIPRAMHDIFKRIEELSVECDFKVRCSFMELYQEQLYDLLSKDAREQSVVELREDRNGILLVGLTEEVVASARETTDCLLRGSSGRAVAATAMNQQSSRSHAIFTVTIEATARDELHTVTTSKFHLVDLAGSERPKKTNASADRFKEGVKINQGLLALGNVISALGSSNSNGFVRYRDSKLTRLLQDSLGGNSVTLMIACVSPADYNVPETLGTLRYADRARKIKNKPIVNQDPHAAEINHLKDVIQKLRMELLAAGGCTNPALAKELQAVTGGAPMPTAPANGGGGVVGGVDPQLYLQLQQKYQKLQQQMQVTLRDVAEIEMRAHISEVSHEKLRRKNAELKGVVGEMRRELHVDADAEMLRQHIERLRAMEALVEEMDGELEHTQSEIDTHKRSLEAMASSTTSAEGDAGSGSMADLAEVEAFMQEQNDAHTTKQMEINDELRRINRELNLKEELQQRVATNLTKLYGLDNNIEEQVKECEAKIKDLESEKADLVDKLKHIKENASAKLAEDRRRRLQTLEQELNDLKKKNLQQSKLLKIRERETQKVVNLMHEIQAMKESKVKLIRTMRTESENFRQLRLAREKEILQLRTKDRKLQNEMARKDALHTKQRNVLKRKFEEIMAVNKRLKDAMDRQTVAQSHRLKMQPGKGGAAQAKVDQLVSWVEREVEVIISLVDAEHSLEQLMDDRGIISRRIGELQSSTDQSTNPATPTTPPSVELAQLREDLEMRNAQIVDLQQKVCAADLDARMASLCESLQSIGDARVVLKQVLKAILQERREHGNRSLEQKAIVEEQRVLRDAAEEAMNTALKRLRALEAQHREDIALREKSYEEKIAVLLRELHNVAAQPAAPGVEWTAEQRERFAIQEEQLNKMEAMREELDSYREMVQEMKLAVQAKKRKINPDTNGDEKPAEGAKSDEEQWWESSEDEDEESHNSALSDPDWAKTPQIRRTRKAKSMSRQSQNSTVLRYSSDSVSVAGPTPAAAPPPKAATKRKSKGCKCRSNCSTSRCGCRSTEERCSMSCQCGSGCCNGKMDGIKEKDDEDGAGDTSAEVTDESGIVAKKKISPLTESNDANQIIAMYATPQKQQSLSDRNLLLTPYVQKFFG